MSLAIYLFFVNYVFKKKKKLKSERYGLKNILTHNKKKINKRNVCGTGFISNKNDLSQCNTVTFLDINCSIKSAQTAFALLRSNFLIA